ncbi:hypothetical protein Pelo_10399 [Pelomyxa schiedti]|nr:hypothetical protein Pelo_10399 [Pelomyxa schiedti]
MRVASREWVVFPSHHVTLHVPLEDERHSFVVFALSPTIGIVTGPRVVRCSVDFVEVTVDSGLVVMQTPSRENTFLWDLLVADLTATVADEIGLAEFTNIPTGFNRRYDRLVCNREWVVHFKSDVMSIWKLSRIGDGPISVPGDRRDYFAEFLEGPNSNLWAPPSSSEPRLDIFDLSACYSSKSMCLVYSVPVPGIQAAFQMWCWDNKVYVYTSPSDPSDFSENRIVVCATTDQVLATVAHFEELTYLGHGYFSLGEEDNPNVTIYHVRDPTRPLCTSENVYCRGSQASISDEVITTRTANEISAFDALTGTYIFTVSVPDVPSFDCAD